MKRMLRPVGHDWAYSKFVLGLTDNQWTMFQNLSRERKDKVFELWLKDQHMYLADKNPHPDERHYEFVTIKGMNENCTHPEDKLGTIQQVSEFEISQQGFYPGWMQECGVCGASRYVRWPA